ncbi:uncharacterized protein LOC106081159 [Stomoxys calcitrans]|uniref:uncharacterized protein LOC106081159 n=1 Tax=Stomoxys calcitrans TaxID=35570 RepID=UPI0027E38C3A|nr:uncharacterized protein LOC106081159 [Stomoxys calcitrans]
MDEVEIMRAEFEAVQEQNDRLMNENTQLRRELQLKNNEERSKSALNVEAKLKAFEYENDRDRMYEQLEKLKLKYNQLHVAFVAKVKRCKAFEEVFNRQKTLNGLVMKSATAKGQKEPSSLLEGRQSENSESVTIHTLNEQVTTLKNELAEAYDIIDELEFELESIDILEMENQRLQEELKSIKKEKLRLRTGIAAHWDDGEDESNEFEGAPRFGTDSVASSLAESIAGDMDPETVERAALTESLVRLADVESNSLRRELLRSRLRKTVRDMRPTSTDA